MTANEAIAIVDKLRPNQIETEIKIAWIKQIEKTIYNEIYITHDNGEIPFTDLDSETFADDKLFADIPYDKLYTDYLCAMIDNSNAEYERYNNDLSAFSSKYSDFEDFYNRQHMPVSTNLTY